LPEQVRADLALLEVAPVNPVDAARQSASGNDDARGGMPNIHRRHHLPACHIKIIFRLTIGEQASPMEGWMTITKQDIDAALARLTEAFPQTFVLEKYRPHRPLKVGIAADIPARCPAVERRVLSAALSAYARRVMYLRALVAGAARVDLDGNPAGEVTAGDAEFAATKLAEILASRDTKRAATVDKGAAQVAKPAAARAAAAARLQP
jgi:hypothetical protein